MEMDGTAGVSGHRHADESLLDNPALLTERDPGGMLRFTASAGAQVRESAALAAEANLSLLEDDGRPRAVVIAVSAPPGGPVTCWPRWPAPAARCR